MTWNIQLENNNHNKQKQIEYIQCQVIRELQNSLDICFLLVNFFITYL